VVFNAGNANCCTGERGMQNARRMCELAARKVGCNADEVLVCSTGIIGHQLPMEKVEAGIEAMTFSREACASEAAARASMTTDIVPKYVAAQAEIDGRTVTVGGQAKGVGMIGPDMAPLTPRSTLHATMLSFLTTDAQVDKGVLQQILESAVERSFNSVTVDGDTSTNDTCILLANGRSGVEITETNAAQLLALVQTVCTELAKKVARDGEGATKLVTIEVGGAATESDARQIAMTIANSPLVKTAIFGRDPNWGRLAMAAGRAGVAFDAQKLSIQLGDVEVFRNGEPSDFDPALAEAAMEPENLTIKVLLGDGDASWHAWTCDFSYEYVKINAEYHT
jgi:glutamate N-acetyltransferase/amino-acid N-acetyltransferase